MLRLIIFSLYFSETVFVYRLIKEFEQKLLGKILNKRGLDLLLTFYFFGVH